MGGSVLRLHPSAPSALPPSPAGRGKGPAPRSGVGRVRATALLQTWFALSLALLLAACGGAKDDRTTLVVQRFFGACEAEYGRNTAIHPAEGASGTQHRRATWRGRGCPYVSRVVVAV